MVLYLQVASDGRVKLADLGAATAVADVAGSILGAPLYNAPEVCSQEKYTEKADIFSLGMVLWQLWYGKDINILQEKAKGPRTTVMEQWCTIAFPDEEHTKPEEPWKVLMEKCWQVDPSARPSAYECVKTLHKYVIDNL